MPKAYVADVRFDQERLPAFGRPRGQPALVDGELVAVAYDHRALDDVLQLAHVPRPRIRSLGDELARPASQRPGQLRVLADNRLGLVQHGSKCGRAVTEQGENNQRDNPECGELPTAVLVGE